MIRHKVHELHIDPCLGCLGMGGRLAPPYYVLFVLSLTLTHHTRFHLTSFVRRRSPLDLTLV